MKTAKRKAWVLTRTRVYDSGKKVPRIEGVALTNKAASRWVSMNDTEGEARTAMPYEIIDAESGVTDGD